MIKLYLRQIKIKIRMIVVNVKKKSTFNNQFKCLLLYCIITLITINW